MHSQQPPSARGPYSQQPDGPAPDRPYWPEQPQSQPPHRNYQSTEDVEAHYNQNPRGHQKRRRVRVGPSALVVVGWFIMVWAISQPLLASLQALAIGLGLLVSAVMLQLLQGQKPPSR